MNEQKNNLENNNPENLDYSFDFANQVEPEKTVETITEVPAAPTTETITVEESAAPQMVDVSVPVMDDAIIGENKVPTETPVMTEPMIETPVAEPIVETPQPVPVAEPVVETPQPAPVAEPVVETPQPAPVAEPVVETPQPTPVVEPAAPVVEQTTVEVPVQENTSTTQTETTEEIKDGKSTIRFVIILVVVIVAFIIALPFILNLLGY